MNDKILKYTGYKPRSIHVLAMLMILVRYLSSLMAALRCFYKI